MSAKGWRKRQIAMNAERKCENCGEFGTCCQTQVAKEGKDFTISKPWVGLTEQEQGAIMEDLNAHGTNLYHFAKAIEAKLREKNST